MEPTDPQRRSNAKVPWRIPLVLTIAPFIGSVIGLTLHAEMAVVVAAIASPGLSLAAGIILGRCTGSTTLGRSIALLLWTVASVCVSVLLQFAGRSLLDPKFGGSTP
jgi:hypothetical protein